MNKCFLGARDSLTIWPVVWKASSTMLSSWSDAARWKTEKMFFQPERMFAAWELTIWAIHRTTMSLIVGDLVEQKRPNAVLHKLSPELRAFLIAPDL